MYRISVTTLEKFRRMMVATSSFDTEQALLDNLTGKFEGNDKTFFGTAFHKIVEEPELIRQPYDLIVVTDRGRTVGVPRHIATHAVRYRQSHPLMFCEVSASKVYETERGPVKVAGRIDGIEGAHVRDTKTKYRQPGVDEYLDSCQWKFYLDMLEAKAFHYDVFEIVGFEGLGNSQGMLYPLTDGGLMEIIPHEPITCCSYPGIADDCRRIVKEFMDWIAFRGLWHLLKQDGAGKKVPAAG